MGRQRSPNRDKAFAIFKSSGGKISSAEIAEQLGEKLANINTWRTQDKWKDKVNKVGAPYGNQNGIGNSGGAAPTKNSNHYIHGLFSKYFPKATVDIMRNTERMEPIDILYLNIQMKFAAIIRSQKIMFVKNQKDTTRELKKIKVQSDVKNNGTRDDKEFEAIENYREEDYIVQFAWDKQAQFLKAQSTAMAQLTNMIRRYDEMIHKNWDTATDEQKARIEKMRAEVEKIKKVGSDGVDDLVIEVKVSSNAADTG